MPRSRVVVLLLSVFTLLLALAASAHAETPECSGEPSSIRTLHITVAGVPTYGYYAVPSGTPKGVVVVGHGYPATAQSMAPLLPGIAARDGVIAVAMDYHGTVDVEGPTGTTSRGWKVAEGAEDSIAAVRLIESACQGSSPRFVNSAFGVSMGGNMTGLAVSQHATRSDGSGLFDYWFDVSGVTNVPEIYTDATVISLAPLGSIQAIGTNAKADIEAEMGGNPLLALLTYLNRSPALRASTMKASGLKGVVVAHGVLDGEVTSDQSDQMVAALAIAGVPTDYYTSVFKAPETPPGLTLDGDILGLIPGYESPFAGHVNAIVLETALGRLDALYQEAAAPSGLKVTLADGSLGTFPLL
jgi:pimeloyl-ACP methyl ester carboxylesterase